MREARGQGTDAQSVVPLDRHRHLRSRLYNELVWRPSLVLAGLAPEPTKDARGRKRYANNRQDGMHALRHYYASVLLAEGVSIRELAEYLGHSDPGFTLRTYIHMLPDSHERAINAIDGRLFRPRSASSGAGAELNVRLAVVSLSARKAVKRPSFG